MSGFAVDPITVATYMVGGLLLAALFDGLLVVGGFSAKWRTGREKWRAFVGLLAFHGPWGVGGGLLLSGTSTRVMTSLGLAPELAVFGALLPTAAVAVSLTWIVQRLSFVKRASSMVGRQMGAAK
jgi:hypothetical protein